jgi:uncharacterized protein YcfJ
MKHVSLVATFAFVISALVLNGCATSGSGSGMDFKGLIGPVVGAGAGGMLGNELIGGKNGSIIGAVVGAGAGHLVQNGIENRQAAKAAQQQAQGPAPVVLPPQEQTTTAAPQPAEAAAALPSDVVYIPGANGQQIAARPVYDLNGKVVGYQPIN